MHGEIQWDTSPSAPDRREPVWTPLGCPVTPVVRVEHMVPPISFHMPIPDN